MSGYARSCASSFARRQCSRDAFSLSTGCYAISGVVDAAGVLWLSGEHYERERPLAYHLERLPRDVHWYADPSGAREIHELRYAGLKIERAARKRATIAAVRRRLAVVRNCASNPWK